MLRKKRAKVVLAVLMIILNVITATLSGCAEREPEKLPAPESVTTAETDSVSAPESSVTELKTEPETTAAETEIAETEAESATVTATESEAATTAKSTTATTTEASTATTTSATAATTTAATTAPAAATTAAPEPEYGSPSDIIIIEICAKNKSVIEDFSGDYPDWIELKNTSDLPVNLSGCGLSDDINEPMKWKFPDTVIEPKGYLIVFCSDKDLYTPELHTSFKISGAGETVYLFDKSGKSIDSLTVPELPDDVTYGIAPSGEPARLSATPGKENIALEALEPSAPAFSMESGFYGNEISVEISAGSGCEIYYTLDGSIPDATKNKYSGAITVKDRTSEKAVLTYKKGVTADSKSEQFPNQEFEKATVLRAVAVDKDGKASRITTASYFIGQSIASKYKNVSVISVVSDPDGLYNSKDGIFVAGDTFTKWRKENPNAELDGSAQGNYNQRGREWEREAHIDYFKKGELSFSENVGMRTHGGWSRNSQQKSMKFYFREEYGSKKLEFELFEGNRDYVSNGKIKEYKRFMIRNGGNDAFSLLYKDAWTQSLVKPVVCFLDGEYWGLYTAMELYDDNYIEENYGIDKDNAVMIKAGSLEEGVESDFGLWESARKFVEGNDMSKPENYKKACEYFDIDSFAEYIAFNLYIGNEDWIWGNWAAFRARDVSDQNKFTDGRWRFMCYDTEFSMNLYGNGGDYKYDIFTQLANGDGHLGPMLKSLLKNGDFRTKFITACEDVMNIAFNPSSAGAALDSFHEKYSPYISQHFKRYIFWQSLQGIENNKNSWKGWLKNRHDYFPTQMNSVLKLGGNNTNTLKINIDGKGYIYIDGLPVTTVGKKWSGEYFGGYKITVTAKAASGYEFKGWSGDLSGNGATIEIDPNKDLSLIASFAEK